MMHFARINISGTNITLKQPLMQFFPGHFCSYTGCFLSNLWVAYAFVAGLVDQAWILEAKQGHLLVRWMIRRSYQNGTMMGPSQGKPLGKTVKLFYSDPQAIFKDPFRRGNNTLICEGSSIYASAIANKLFFFVRQPIS
ncbi:hypothetical protein HanIR_Chr17g0888831 [Helianthus annuus]|nr:hypothetical protein HanIR_Chr17g0888831 [Helianthus annuus]